jgi:hypothetical protein
MIKNRFGPIWLAGALLILVSLACISLQAPTPTAVPTNTSTATSLPSATARPTNTLWPTATPNLAATQVYADFYSQVEDYQSKGYFPSTDGTYYKLEDYSQSWAQINWYQWLTIERYVTNFVLNAHFRWSTASSTPEDSGCGFIFALQSNNDNYAVFLDKSRIVFLQDRIINGKRGGFEVGKTKGTGRVDIESDPAEADFSLAVNDHTAYVYVNKEFIGQYTLSEDSTMDGQLAYSMLSGTNKDYGTKCDMTNVQLWQLK